VYCRPQTLANKTFQNPRRTFSQQSNGNDNLAQFGGGSEQDRSYYPGDASSRNPLPTEAQTSVVGNPSNRKQYRQVLEDID
jgi:hypothetical protein